MSRSNIYGQIIDGDDVEQAVVASMSQWMNTYLFEIERKKGYQPGQIERPRGIVTSSEFEKWPEDQLPVILVISMGLHSPPVKRANGIYDAEWQVGLAPVVSDVDQPSTRRLALAYAAAVRVALGQHAMLKSVLHPDGFSHYVDWIGEDYTNLPFSQTRTMMAGQVLLAVGVESVMTREAGPRTVPADPSIDPGDWPAAEPDPAFTAKPISLTGAMP